MGGSRSLKIKRSLSRISFRQEKGVSTDHPPVPALDVDSRDHREPVFERPIYLQPLATRSLSDSPGTSRRTSAISPTSPTFPASLPASPTRTEVFSRSIDLLAAHQSISHARQRSNSTVEQTPEYPPERADVLSAHQLVIRQGPAAPSPKPDNMFTQANMVLVEQAADSSSAHAQHAMSQASLGAAVATGQQQLDRSGLFKRIFSRQAKGSKNQSLLEQPPHDGFDSGYNNSVIPKMGPSPHTHPLLSKPYARDEILHRRPQNKHRNGLSESTLSIARRKGELALASRSASVRLAAAGLPEGNGGPPNPPESHDDDSRESEKATANTGTEAKSVREWGFFVNCYAEGRFNVSNPPDPPPQPPGFNYLVAPLPPDEAERLEAVEQVVTNYPDWARSKAHHLVHLARKVFGTCYASISLIDGQNELMKAGYGYQTSFICRSVSIGAHVLLSTNAMIILDADKDWRLQGNPLVKEAPHIRFYAGSPLITPEGYIVGVIAVFDTKPRSDFPLHLRRKLADFAKIASADIEILIEEQEMSKRKAYGPTTVDDKAETLSVKAKRLTTKLLQKIEEESKQAQGVSPSAGNEASTSPSGHTIPHELFVQDGKPDKVQTDFPEPLNVPNKSPSRTWNGTSPVAMTPPQTPSRTSAASEESSLKQTAATTPSSTSRSLSLSSDNDRPNVNRRHRKNLPRPLKDMAKLGSELDTPEDQPQPRSPGPVSSLTEAGFALSLIASTLSYDLVYLLRVRPNPEWEGAEFTEFESLSTRILVAHGLPQPEPVFDPLIHLRALRSEGGVIYQNPNPGSDGVEDELEYGVGVLLPLLRDNIDELPLICTTNADDTEREAERMALIAAKIKAYGSCKGGIVLAAFKKQPGGGHEFSNEEVAYLREMGSGMKDIFINGGTMASPNMI